MTGHTRRVSIAVAVGLASIASAGAAWDWYFALPADALRGAQYVGGSTCAECHASEARQWHGSHHDRAMELATEESVLGDFNDSTFERLGVKTRFFRRDDRFYVNTEGPDGEYHDYEIKYTFGVEPLQQYMVEFPKGRVQVLRVSWDTRKNEWFEVTPPDAADVRLLPSDPSHWTGVAQNWNTTCAECHSTNLQKNYDLATDTYHTTYSEIDVSCEECHGPGSVHVELARSWSLFWDRNVRYGLANLKSADSSIQIDTCAKCHARRQMVHADFRPGQEFLDYFEPSLLLAGLYHDNGQIQDEVYEYGSFLQSKMYAEHVRCTDCHNPHSLELKFSGNRLCIQCHIAGKYDSPLHHHHEPDSPGAQCIECHMPMRTYMVIDDRRDHSFRVPRPDLSVSLGTPNACNDCHTKAYETADWAADAVRNWYGDERPDDPHWAPALAAANRGLPEGERLLAELIRRASTPAIVKATAVSLTAQYRSADMVAVQQMALDDSEPLVRAAAANALSGGASAHEMLIRIAERLSDPVRTVRLAAVERVAGAHGELDTAYRAPFDRSLTEFRDSQSLIADRAAAHMHLGRLEQQLGHPERAADEIRTAIRLEPYLTGPRSELANLLATAPGSEAEVRDLREEEAELMVRDCELLPENGDVFYRLGLLRYLLGQLDEASVALKEACRLEPNVYEYRMALALLEERRYESDGGETHYESAKEALATLQRLRPDDPRAGQILKRLEATHAARPANR